MSIAKNVENCNDFSEGLWYTVGKTVQEAGMEILYQDKEIVVCVKPVGLDSEKEVPSALAVALGGMVYPIHRLD